MRHGLALQGRSDFYVEAVVGVDNRPSQRVAEKVISDAPTAVQDQVSGEPALQYIRRISLNPFVNPLESEHKPHKEGPNPRASLMYGSKSKLSGTPIKNQQFATIFA
jgi:hypothetical protein